MPITITKSGAINDLSKEDNAVLYERSKFLFEEVEKEFKNLSSSERGIKDAISKMGKKVVGATTKEERIRESFVDLGAMMFSTFILLNPSMNLPDDFTKKAEKTLSSVTCPSNIKHLQENLRSILNIKEQEK